MLEDFADLDIEEESSTKPREDRMRAAFEKSKAGYANEQVFTEPGWYDPPEIPPPTKLHIRNIDYGLNSMYLKREYSKALALALSQIEVEETNNLGDGREFQLIDLAIRCALKTGDNQLAGRLSDKTTRKWSSNIGLALTAAEAYLAASRPRDALSAILTVIPIRGPQLTYVVLLHDALTSLRQELQNSDALESILAIVKAYIMHRRSSAVTEAPIIIDEANARTWLEQCGITGIDQENLLALICHRTSSDMEGSEGRSVRTL